MSYIRSSLVLLFVLIISLSSSHNLYASKPFVYDVDQGSCYGYASDVCSLAKREHELGLALRLGFSTKTVNNDDDTDRKTRADDTNEEEDFSMNALSIGLGLGYQYNLNSYFSVRTDIGGDVILDLGSKNTDTGDDTTETETTSTNPIYGFAFDAGVGFRVFPWKDVFYMGVGGMFRAMMLMTPATVAEGAVKGALDDISLQLYGYVELGLFFPSKTSSFEINVKIRSDILSLFSNNKSTNTDDASSDENSSTSLPLSKKWDTIGKMPFTFSIGWFGLFGKFGAIPAEYAYDALSFVRDQNTYITFSNIFFDSESTVLSVIAEAEVQNILKLAKVYNPSMIIIRGYGDVQDKNIKKQQKLANSRAQIVLEYLVSRGVQKDKIIAVGIPVKRATTQMLKERNQRLEIVLVR